MERSERGRARGRSMQSTDVKPGTSGGQNRTRRKIEDLIVTKPKDLPTKIGSSEDSVPIRLKANCFPLDINLNWNVYMFQVDFDPPEDDTRIKKKMLHSLSSDIGGYLYDGTNLYSPKNNKEKVLCCKRETDGEKITVTIRYVKTCPPHDSHAITINNIVMKRIFSCMKLVRLGRDFFDPSAVRSLKIRDLLVWPGYSTSIRQHQNQVLLRIEIAHRVTRKDTAWQEWRDISKRETNPQQSFREKMIGKTVMTHYNNTTYKIDDITFEQTPLSTFNQKGTDVSFVDYYYNRYNIKIRDKDQPMLVHKNKSTGQQVILVPELCSMTGLTDAMRSETNVMKALSDITRLQAHQRLQKLMDFTNKIAKNTEVQELMTKWNLSVSSEPVTIMGRTFKGQRISGGDARISNHREAADWNDIFKQGLTLFRPTNLTRWLVIIPSKMRENALSFLNVIRRVGEKMNMTMERQDVEYIHDDRKDYPELLDKMISRKNYTFIVCFVNNNASEPYGSIKKKLCFHHSVPNQVITNKAASSNNMSIATKIAVQMNCKLGGAPWTVPMPKGGMMVVGYDVSHGFGAMVASMDAQATKYHSTVLKHKDLDQLSLNVGLQMNKALLSYARHNNNELPNRIILYRDGVSDGQIPHIFETEVLSVKTAISNIYQNRKCGFAFIIVNKRGGIRLFAENRNQISNPPAGTVVDTEITLPERYDFYLVSQHVRHGSVSPTSYNIIADDTGLKPHQIQLLTYRLTHMYFNWSGTVKVPAPVQYAHKLVFLCGQHIKEAICKEGMVDTLYYL